MKRTIYIITLGYIIGIIGGLLIKKVSLFIFLLILITLVLKYSNIKSKSKIYRVIRVFIKNNIILIFLISALISSIRLYYIQEEYSKIEKEFKEKELIGKVISDVKKGNYTDTYKIKLIEKEFKNKYFLLRVPNKVNLEYGDKIKFDGKYTISNNYKNYKSFNYKEYLKEQKIYGVIETKKVRIIEKN